MLIAVPKERRAFESRVAATPDAVKKYIALGYQVLVESGAGVDAGCPDESYVAAGAQIETNTAQLYKNADIVLKVQRPMDALEGVDESGLLKTGACLVGMLNPYGALGEISHYSALGLTTFSVDLMPRITRAQSMDVLSSQSNLAGYKAVVEAAALYGRAFPMMMTAAGTVPPAKVFVMGCGVAGLQAIATARRLGAVVSATDVRMAAKEQVKSLGAQFVMVENEETRAAETAGGYAKEMSDEYKKLQSALIAETIKKQDIVICTALIPGKAAPRLITEEMLHTLKPGSIVIDLAVEQGGNCALSEPGKIIESQGIKIVGYRNMPSRIAADASALYARNLLSFITHITAKTGGSLQVDWADEIVSAVTLTKEGAIVHPLFK